MGECNWCENPSSVQSRLYVDDIPVIHSFKGANAMRSDKRIIRDAIERTARVREIFDYRDVLVEMSHLRLSPTRGQVSSALRTHPSIEEVEWSGKGPKRYRRKTWDIN